MLNKFCGFVAGYNGDRERDYSVSTIGDAVCLVVLPESDLKPQKDTACWKTFPAG